VGAVVAGFHAPAARVGRTEGRCQRSLRAHRQRTEAGGRPVPRRAYRQLADRFHLQEWEQSIQRKLDTVEGVYKVLADQAATARAELLEIIIVLLILLETILAVVRR